MSTSTNQSPQLPQTDVSKSAFSLSLDNLENEEWIDALGFDGIYQVSNYGRVKTLGRWVSNGKSERWVKERIRKLYIRKKERSKTFSGVAKAMAEQWGTFIRSRNVAACL